MNDDDEEDPPPKLRKITAPPRRARNDGITCLNCPYSVEHLGWAENDETTLHCHRYPPHVADDDFITVWVEVFPEDFCGEHPHLAHKLRGGVF